MARFHRLVIFTTAAMCLVISACSQSDSAPSAVSTSAGSDLYLAPTNLGQLQPGDLIRSQIFETTSTFTGFKVLYASRSVSNKPVAVSGMVWVPNAPTQGNPLVSYAHGTTGIADECAPTKSNAPGETGLIANILVEKGYIFAATDYEGLGTPGVHPYIVGQSEARSMLDIIRAARQLTESSGQSVLWGHSQGGGAALMAAEVAPTYAPDTKVIGAIGGAPVVELDKLARVFSATDSFGFMFMVAAGFKAAYSDIDLSKIFTPKGLDMVKLAETTCTDAITSARGTDVSTYLVNDSVNDSVNNSLSSEPLLTHLRDNTPGNVPTKIPVFVYHGDADELIPANTSLDYLKRTCTTGGYNVERKTYAGATHISVLFSASSDIQSWIANRFSGAAPTPTPCT